MKTKTAEMLDNSQDRKFRSLIENASDIITILGNDGTIQYESPSIEKVLGYTAAELLGRSSWEFIHPDDLLVVHAAFNQVLSNQRRAVGFEFRYLHKNGEWRRLELTGTNLLEDEDVEGIVVNSRDVTDRKNAEESLRVSEERYALAMRGANDGLWDWDLGDNELFLSSRWKEMLGYEDWEISANPEEWFERIHSEDRGGVQHSIETHLRGDTGHFQAEYRICRKDGEYLYVLCRGLAVRDANGHAYRMAGSQSDITARKEAERRLQHDALHDALTGLPNRTLLLDRLGVCMARAGRRNDYIFAILFLDLDRFKLVNDSLGHSAGDHVLMEVTRILQGCVRPQDTISRFGGDEFVILLDGLEDISSATRAAQRMQDAIARPFSYSSQEMFTTCSAGIAISNPDYQKPEEMVRDADAAMYRAKANGKARYEVFDKSMHSRMLSQLRLETDLRHAVQRKEIEVWYQPIVSVTSRKPEGFEALARWRHPKRGVVPPSAFIPIAEETGLVAEIGAYVLEQACRQIKQWQELTGDESLTVAVNLSPRQFMQHDLLQQVKGVLLETGLAAHCLKLEITESAVMRDPEAAGHILRKLRDVGVKVCLDDFGTGYSSLSYLLRFPIDTLKIDRSFVTGMDLEAERFEIVSTIVKLANNLNMSVVAEGVETEPQLQRLRGLHCESAQGYLFSKPVKASEAAELLKGAMAARA
ncbi:MAG TPA: EAL domain-containing protein [Terriglobales bacterium]|nr:EAL domain-containing protein [Terriglobales bacterium]